MPLIKQLYADEIKLFWETIINFINENNTYVADTESFAEAEGMKEYVGMVEKINDGKAIAYGAIKDNGLLGFIYAYEKPFREDDSRLYVSILHVDEQVEKQRLAEILLYQIEQAASNKGYGSIFLITEKLNDETMQFYKKLGYVVERIQLVKKQLKKIYMSNIKDKNIDSFGVQLLTTQMVNQYKNELAELFLLNTQSHILTDSFDYNFSFTKINDLIGYVKENKALVAGYFDHQKLIGFMWVFPYRYKKIECYMVNAIVVYPEYRNKNIASMLYNTIESILSESGKQLYTYVDFANNSAYRLYKNHGMVEENYQLVRRVKSE